MENYLLGCDWGTSSFRLNLYSLAEEKSVAELQSADGISAVHRNWQISGQQNRNDFFRGMLLDQIRQLQEKTGIEAAHLPLVISGMASSSIGMEDVPYAQLPFPLDGSRVNTRRFAATKFFPHELVLISGVKSRMDVMRGEETQLIGTWAQLSAADALPDEAIFIFPGTHSKHAYVRDGQLVDFKTYMTGEVFQVLGSHSILRDSVTEGAEQFGQLPSAQHAFRSGVRDAQKSNLLNSLFRVRTNQLFGQFPEGDNRYYLSGLLIGTELSTLPGETGIFLCCSQQLLPFYQSALNELSLEKQVSLAGSASVETAAVAGQAIVYQELANKQTAS